jgi:hypothetical protein
MLSYVNGMVDSNGHYSILGIVQFALGFFGLKRKTKDQPGVYCTELTGKAIEEAGLPYVTSEPNYTVTPSDQRSWFETDEAKAGGWYLALWYTKEEGFCKKKVHRA